MTEVTSIRALRSMYQEGKLTPEQLVKALRQRAQEKTDYNIFIHLLTDAELAPYLAALHKSNVDALPLWGIPFVIKDNIDLAGIPTTAGCPDFSYTPSKSATVVELLIQKGAIPIGKTNLDQFATGLNGTRSPYGTCHNAHFFDYISGGSSSGTAVAIASQIATFGLGTDTAGSGRVPAAFHGLIGLKPTRGLVSRYGVVPACYSLDCVSIMANDLDDANLVLEQVAHYDFQDAYSRHNLYQNGTQNYGKYKTKVRLGVLTEKDLDFFGDSGYQGAYQDYIEALKQRGDVELVPVDYAPFEAAAKLLYEGPWVSERYIACQSIMTTNPSAIYPAVRDIIAGGKTPLATDLFRAEYQLHQGKQRCDAIMRDIDALLLPTAGRMYRIDEMLAEPISNNSRLGKYTNFVNLLDYSALAIPAAKADDERPFGVTLIGMAFADRDLLGIANLLQKNEAKPMSCTRAVDVAVCGAHLSGMPLNWQLKNCNAQFVKTTKTAKQYRLYALNENPEIRPALVRHKNGVAIEVEVWRIPMENFGAFVAAIPSPLGIGKVALEDESVVCGFICEHNGISEKDKDISQFGGWRAYKKHGTC